LLKVREAALERYGPLFEEHHVCAGSESRAQHTPDGTVSGGLVAGQVANLIHGLGSVKDGNLVQVSGANHQVEDEPRADRIKARCRLTEEIYSRPANQTPRDLEPPPHSDRELFR